MELVGRSGFGWVNPDHREARGRLGEAAGGALRVHGRGCGAPTVRSQRVA